MALAGVVERCTGCRLAGWVWNSGGPEERVAVTLLLDGAPAAQLVAGDYREDLAKAGVGDGCYGFAFDALASDDLAARRVALAFPGAGIAAIEVEGWRCPVAIPGISPAELQREAKRLGGMFHSIDLGGGHYTDGLKTPERMALELAMWRFPEGLQGRTVLDIGCADGGWSIAAYRRGARSVVSIDERMTGAMRFLLERKVFPLDFRPIDLFSPEFGDLPEFDVVLFTGVLYHTQHPLEALKRVRSKTRELAIIETHINERLGSAVPCMVFYESDELGGDPTNWWGPNIACLEGMLRTAGFAFERVFHEVEGGRVCYHLRPEAGSLTSTVLRSATGGYGVLEEYRQRVASLEERIREVEASLGEPRPTDPRPDPRRGWFGRNVRLGRRGR